MKYSGTLSRKEERHEPTLLSSALKLTTLEFIIKYFFLQSSSIGQKNQVKFDTIWDADLSPRSASIWATCKYSDHFPIISQNHKSVVGSQLFWFSTYFVNSVVDPLNSMLTFRNSVFNSLSSILAFVNSELDCEFGVTCHAFAFGRDPFEFGNGVFSEK